MSTLTPHPSFPFVHFLISILSYHCFIHRCYAYTLAQSKYYILSAHICLTFFQTRSRSGTGLEFSTWDGPHVTATDPTFNFEEFLKRSTHRAQAAEYDYSGLFSLSPLTSPEPFPPSSPVLPLFPTLEQAPPPIDETSMPQTLYTEPIIAVHQPVDRVKKKTQNHASRSKRRAKGGETRFSPYEARPSVKAKYIDDAAAVSTPSTRIPRVARMAYVALDDWTRSKKQYQLHELVGPASKLGLMLQEWDGSLSSFFFPSYLIFNQVPRTPTPIIDQEGRLVAILAGHPEDDSWHQLSKEGAEALEEARRRCKIPAKAGRHRRGQFISLRCGVSHGGEQTEPGNLQNDYPNDEVLAKLNQKLPFRRMSGFATST